MDSEFTSYDAPAKPWYRWHEPVVLQQQVALMQRNFPVTLLASFAAAVGTVWALHTLVEPAALWLWLVSHLVRARALALGPWPFAHDQCMDFSAVYGGDGPVLGHLGLCVGALRPG
jgi:hypothetical protein